MRRDLSTVGGLRVDVITMPEATPLAVKVGDTVFQSADVVCGADGVVIELTDPLDAKPKRRRKK